MEAPVGFATSRQTPKNPTEGQFYANRPAFVKVMRHAIALNGSFFNTQRMVAQYAAKAYLG